MTNNKIFSLIVILMTIVGISSGFAKGNKESSNSISVPVEQNIIVENSIFNEQIEIEYTLTVINNTTGGCTDANGIVIDPYPGETIPAVKVWAINEQDPILSAVKLGWDEQNGIGRPGRTAIFNFNTNNTIGKIEIHRDNGYRDKPFIIDWPVGVTKLTITLSGQWDGNNVKGYDHVIYNLSFY